nr:protein ALWAYS EARLY 2-like isoform X1 [Ziziphus jujuba var. spinosa]
MAPTRKSRSVNRRFSNLNEVSQEKDAGNSSKNKQRKRKLSDKLGSQWSKEELERFYEGYRKYGKDWKKVAATVRNRSTEMVEALYNMNRAYLSLPEGTASVVGLIAMMTDHYNVLEETESERESNDASGVSRKSQKRKRGKDHLITSKDPFQSHSVASADGCLSLLKKKHFDGNQPRAVGKRTPRFPVSYSHRKDYMENYISPIKRGRKLENENDDEVAHVAALALAEASQRGGSPQVSQTPYRRTEPIKSSPVQSWERMRPQRETARVKVHGSSMDEDWLEGSIGSRGAENGDYAKDSSSLLDMEGVGTVEVHRKGKKFYRKKEKVEDMENDQFDDGGEACSGTDEGLNINAVKGQVEVEVSNSNAERFSPRGQKKRSKELFFGDESSALDALQTLADMSLMMPISTMESESSVQLKEERTTLDIEDKCSVPEATSTSQVRNRNKLAGSKQKVPHAISGVENTTSKKSKLGRDSTSDINTISEAEQQPQSTTKAWKRKRKSLVPEPILPQSKLGTDSTTNINTIFEAEQQPQSTAKAWKRKRKSLVSSSEAHLDSHTSEPSKTEVFCEEENKPVVKGKRTGQNTTPSKQWKSVKSPEGSLSSDYRRTGSDQVVSTSQVPSASQVNLPTKRRSRRKMDLPRALSPKEMIFADLLKEQLNKCSNSVKEKLSRCLLSNMVRRWCTFEWFYSAIDYPWFAKREFEEYLNHVGLGHIPRLTRVEWGVIRSSLGKPRRFSEHFLREEREKLKQYRDSVRKHYSELRMGIREGLPTDLARPLSVGQRVIALHPKTREVHDGSVLTVDHDKCRVQFDRPEIGVELIMDVDCMPLNPLENMPEALRRQNISAENFSLASKELQMNGNLNFGGSMMFASGGHLEKAPSPMNAFVKHGKGDSTHDISQLKAAADFGIAQQAARSQGQPCILANNQAREADIRALSELARALDKKEALLMELNNTNNDILESQNNGDSFLKDSEPFKKDYATVLVQLKEASGQVSSALLHLRQRNTYPGNPLLPWLKHPAYSTIHGGLPSPFDGFSLSQDSASGVEIVRVSRLEAHRYVDVAIQAFLTRKEGEDPFLRIREALDSIDSKPLAPDSRVLVSRSQEQANGNMAHQNQLSSCTAETTLTSDSPRSNFHTDSDKNEAVIPSELITSILATVFMMKTCSERQCPPGDVAQMLESAVTSLHPCCPQNLPLYREIQMCMGILKTKMLALVPT